MAEYIEREALQNLFNDVSTSLLSRGELAKDAEHMVRAFLMVTEMIQDAPAADVELVRHGRWVTHYRSGTTVAEGYVSTCCDMWNNRKSDFCPNCGARMDGEK